MSASKETKLVDSRSLCVSLFISVGKCLWCFGLHHFPDLLHRWWLIGKIGRRVARCEDEDSAAEPAIASLTSLVLRDYLVLSFAGFGSKFVCGARPHEEADHERESLLEPG